MKPYRCTGLFRSHIREGYSEYVWSNSGIFDFDSYTDMLRHIREWKDYRAEYTQLFCVGPNVIFLIPDVRMETFYCVTSECAQRVYNYMLEKRKKR